MKKNIFFLFLILILAACATKKPESRSRFLKGFSAKYNTLFNAKEALKTEFDGRTQSFQDNFYAPYINLITYDDQAVVGENIGTSAILSADDKAPKFAAGANLSDGTNDDNGIKKSATNLEIAEAKALKTIDKYSVTRDGQEKNPKIFDAYMTLIQARIYMNKPLEALDAINTVSTKLKGDKRLPLAKIYQGLAYTKFKDYFKANQIFAELKKEKLTADQHKLVSIYFSESLLKAGKKDEAVAELQHAFEVNNNRKMRSRISFLKGQILSSLGKNEEARKSFLNAYQYANNFEFEVKSEIEIAKTYTSKNNYEEGKKYIENISKKGTYASRKNEFLYALGLMANNAGKKENAQDYFRKALKEKVSDPQIRGLTYFEIGRRFLENDEYISAGAYYDSAVAVMTYDPTKLELQKQSEYIKNLAKNYYLIKKNDSILALTKMNEAQRTAYFSKFIDKMKAKEAAEERAKLKEEREKGFDSGDYNANSVFSRNNNSFQEFGEGGNKGFYFANNNTVAKGSTEFKQVWGNRALQDNWRYSARTASLEDEKNEALGLSSTKNPRRFEPDFYIEKIPTDQTILDGLKKNRDTAALGMGIMYDDYFANRTLATKTLYDLVDQQPEEKVMLRALYEIFSMNFEKNPEIAERAKQILLRDYPYSSYAEFARNPRNKSFVKSEQGAEQAYKESFALYQSGKFTESMKTIEQALKQYPKDALVPKFTLLNAFNSGKTAGKEVMILQLEQIALNYKNTDEGIKAMELLNWLKSDLQVQTTDLSGKPVQENKMDQNNSLTKEELILQETIRKEEEAMQKAEEERRKKQRKENPNSGPPVRPK